VERLRDHHAVFVGDEGARKGDAVEHRVAWLDACVEDPVATDDLGVDVREQREGDSLLLRELGEGLAIVIGDRVEPNARRLELLVGIAQLAELRPTRRSPHRGAEEDDHGPGAGPVLVEAEEAPVLIRKREVWKRLADPGADLPPFGQTQSPGVAERRRGVESEFVALDGHRRRPVIRADYEAAATGVNLGAGASPLGARARRSGRGRRLTR
jgi:hypothetical protein